MSICQELMNIFCSEVLVCCQDVYTVHFKEGLEYGVSERAHMQGGQIVSKLRS